MGAGGCPARAHVPAYPGPRNAQAEDFASNILLDPDLNARLSDMGVARQNRPVTAHMTTVTSIAGTNCYMDGYYQSIGRFDEAADDYALAVSIIVTRIGWATVDPSCLGAHHRSLRSGRD